MAVTTDSPVKDPAWVWCGRSIRYNARTISILAVAETVAASVLALYATFVWGGTKWFALYICIAPFLLLKTKRSVCRGLRWMEASIETIVRWSEFWVRYAGKGSGLLKWVKFPAIFAIWLWLGLVYTILVLFGHIGIKIAATVAEMFQSLRIAVRRIPRNWSQMCLQTDLSILPEMLPDASRAGLRFPAVARHLSTNGYLRYLWEPQSRLDRYFGVLLSLPTQAVMCFFGLGYRWALKATAAFWVLLIFFTRPVFRRGDTLEWRVNDTIKHTLNAGMRWWAVVMIVAHFVVPFVCWQWYGALAQEWVKPGQQMSHLLKYLLVLPEPGQGLSLEAWHIAGGVGGGITWVVWKLAHDYRIALDSKAFGRMAEHKALRTLQGLLWARAALMTYTAFCGMVAVFKTLQWANVDVRWLP